jgi:hypothetical protein
MIEVRIDREGRAGRAVVTLPSGLSGSFVMEGKTTELHPGAQCVEWQETR